MPFSRTTKNLTRAILVAIPVLCILIASLPEVLRDRIYPLDSAQIAANGALFHSLFFEFGDFISAPVDWLWSYFEQYPALSLRRHPPLFGFVAGMVYSVAGVSAVSAKLTVMLFACVFAVGTFYVARRMLNSHLLASCATILVVATPEIALHFSSVWLDIPSLAFAMWVFYFYLARLDGDSTTANVFGMVSFVVLALYMYQPTVILLAGVFVHLLLREWRTVYKDRSLLIGAGVLILVMLPLAATTVYFAMDSLLATTGVIPGAWQEFDSPNYARWMIRDKLSLAYWLDYAKMIAVSYPVQVAGLGFWTILRFVRKPTAAEVLMFTCVVVTYIAFSWLVVKGHRYTLYMMMPVSFLAVVAIRDGIHYLARGSSRVTLYTCLIILMSAALQNALIPAYAPYTKLEGMGVPVASVLRENPNANILYSGRSDAAFVFYTRSLDDHRTATVHRASMQLRNPNELESYVDRENIDFIVLEKENLAVEALDISDQFREAISMYVEKNAEFGLRTKYRLPYGASHVEGHLLLHVYGRSR